MKSIIDRIIPPVSTKDRGPKFPFYFLINISIVSTIRSLIHIFAPDGGANSIAGLAIDLSGGTNIVAIFAQWGTSQLILVFFYWVAILRYRFLIPLMLGIFFLEQVLRVAVRHLKPLEVAAPRSLVILFCLCQC